MPMTPVISLGPIPAPQQAFPETVLDEDVRIGTVINIQVGSLGTFKQDLLVRLDGLVDCN